MKHLFLITIINLFLLINMPSKAFMNKIFLFIFYRDTIHDSLAWTWPLSLWLQGPSPRWPRTARRAARTGGLGAICKIKIIIMHYCYYSLPDRHVFIWGLIQRKYITSRGGRGGGFEDSHIKKSKKLFGPGTCFQEKIMIFLKPSCLTEATILYMLCICTRLWLCTNYTKIMCSRDAQCSSEE